MKNECPDFFENKRIISWQNGKQLKCGNARSVAIPHQIFTSLNCRTQSACASRSKMMALTRIKPTAIEYIQKHRAINSIPHNIVCAIAGALVTETEAPWCKVFHHFTEK